MNIDDILLKDEFKSLDEFLTQEMLRLSGRLLLKKLLDFYEKDFFIARSWFYSSCLGLGGERPYDYCLRGERKKVITLITQLEDGVYV